VETGNGNWIGVSQFLNHFNFTGAKQHVFVSKLSGGERKRLYLLTILLRNPNFLILDEPTNDLDIVTLNILEEFLENYQGCLMMVTHDRYFMDRLVDHVFVLDGTGGVKDIHGNYTEYRNHYEDMPSSSSIRKAPAEVAKVQVAVPTASPAKRKLSFKEQKELESLDTEIPDLEKRKAEMVHVMNSGLEHAKLQEVSAEFQRLESEIDSKTMRWLELQELNS
jgi:ATP-binding cassette subfamily F protein uup